MFQFRPFFFFDSVVLKVFSHISQHESNGLPKPHNGEICHFVLCCHVKCTSYNRSTNTENILLSAVYVFLIRLYTTLSWYERGCKQGQCHYIVESAYLGFVLNWHVGELVLANYAEAREGAHNMDSTEELIKMGQSKPTNKYLISKQNYKYLLSKQIHKYLVNLFGFSVLLGYRY